MAPSFLNALGPHFCCRSNSTGVHHQTNTDRLQFALGDPKSAPSSEQTFVQQEIHSALPPKAEICRKDGVFQYYPNIVAVSDFGDFIL
jgi:hypothetical protein